MRALTYDGPWRVKVRNKPDPRLEHPQDGIVRVSAAAICGSDLHLLHGLQPDTRIGSVFGHEFVGTVEEVGPQVEGVKKGDRVMLPFQIFCGGCFFCAQGLTSCCENTNPATDAGTGIYGYSHTMGGYDGGQAQYVRVPFIGVDAEHLLEHVQAGRIRPSRVFTHKLPLEAAPAAYRTFAQKKDGCIKVALFPNGGLH